MEGGGLARESHRRPAALSVAGFVLRPTAGVQGATSSFFPAGVAARGFGVIGTPPDPDPEVRIDFYGTDRIPYAGTWTGRDGTKRFFRTVHEWRRSSPEGDAPAGCNDGTPARGCPCGSVCGVVRRRERILS